MSLVERTLISTRLWKGGELPLMELASLWMSAEGALLQGHVTGIQENVPFALLYRVECDAAWRTRHVWLELDTPPKVRELHISVDEAQHWTVNGEHHAGLDGLLDVDIQVSPSTNTLPIRRLRMRPGNTYDVVSAWIQVPALAMEPLSQQYACTDVQHFNYRSGDLTAELSVDEHRLMERYGDFWHRIDPH